MTEAIPFICVYDVDNSWLHRIEGLVERENVNCKGAIEKLSFTHDGVMRDCEMNNGKFISLDIGIKLKTN